MEALATQCFLNEYVYWQSEEEQSWIDNLIIEARKNQDNFNQNIAIIGCYIPIH